MKIQIKKKLQFLIKISLFFLFLNTFLDSTVLTESSEATSDVEDSYSEWFFKNKGKIFIATSIITIVIIFFFNNGDTTSPCSLEQIEIKDTKIVKPIMNLTVKDSIEMQKMEKEILDDLLINNEFSEPEITYEDFFE